MRTHAWIGFSAREKTILMDALSCLRKSGRARTEEVDALTLRLLHSEAHPKITIGVHGGQVQWVSGNPFPVRVCDYDGDREELPDVDDWDQRCRMWLEPTDRKSQSRERRR
jgi:hypothetical protein